MLATTLYKKKKKLQESTCRNVKDISEIYMPVETFFFFFKMSNPNLKKKSRIPIAKSSIWSHRLHQKIERKEKKS